MNYAMKTAKFQTMKTRISFVAMFFVAFLATSCNVERSEKYQALLAERDSLYTEAVAAKGGFDNALNTINEIENALESIRAQENIIMMENQEGNTNKAVLDGLIANIGDFANDDDFSSAWTSHPTVEEPWWEVDLKGKKRISLVTIVEETKGSIQTYKLEYKKGKRWHTIFEGLAPECRVKQHRFSPVKAEKVRITIKRHHGKLALAEVGVY